jgi:hypothetical protein
MADNHATRNHNKRQEENGMKIRARLTTLIGALLMAAAWSAPTAADPPQTYEDRLTRCSAAMPLPDGTTECNLEPFYLECLAEYVVGEYQIAGSYQDFTTPSGTAHLRDNWKVVSVLHGVTTGRAWYAVGVAPLSANFDKTETWSATATGSLVYKPLADGPKWHEQFVARFTQDLNGDIAVVLDKNHTRCLGPR